MISDPNGLFWNSFINELSKYKTVDNGGNYQNNIGRRIPYNIHDKIVFLREYKFSIAMENSKTLGYITEKLVEAYVGHVYYY